MVAEDGPIYLAHWFGNACWLSLYNIYRRAMPPHRGKNGPGSDPALPSDFIWEDIAVNRKIAGVDEDNEAWQTCTVACLNIQAIVVIPVVCEFNVVCNETMLSGTPTGPMQTPDTVI